MLSTFETRKQTIEHVFHGEGERGREREGSFIKRGRQTYLGEKRLGHLTFEIIWNRFVSSDGLTLKGSLLQLLQGLFCSLVP